MGRKQKKRKLTPRAKAKKDAWDMFSLYIRLKHADKNGDVTCITCGKVANYKKMQASHLVPGRTERILFDERGVYPCCYRCNCVLSGNLLNYMKYLEETLGVKKAIALREELQKNAKIPLKRTIADYQELIELYKDKIKTLIKKKKFNFKIKGFSIKKV